MKDSEETATAFTVKLAITRDRSFSLLIHESKCKRMWLEAVSFRRIATVEQLNYSWNRNIHSQLYRIPCAATPRGIMYAYNYSASLDSRPRRERRPGILCMRMRVHYPKKGVIRVFVDTVSKINRILFVF